MTALPVVVDAPAPPREPSPRVAALDALWRDARHRLFRPRAFLTWLRLTRSFDLRFIRPAEVKVEVPRGLVPDCESCVEICCTGPNALVSLRLRDIAALVDAGHAAHIVARPAVAPTDGSWARYELETSVFAAMFPVLARDATGTCALLDDERRCGAYPAWPLSCARYPYALDALRKRVFLAKGCHSHRLVTLDDAPDAIRRLVDASVQAYNERIKDVILLHVALDELTALGLVEHLRLSGRLAHAAAKRAAGRAPGATP